VDDIRPDPDALIAAAAREGRGQLKVFLGAAPGVGKTWEMLSQARRRAAEGHNVLAGVIETHGRAETQAQIGDLPILPRLQVPYRGQTLEEFDLDAALLRRPGLLLVDELAHTNAPGSRHNKRWEDVEELLAAGLDVWATLNVQHLESLNDDVARITGVRVTETLPDRVLEGANEIELIDVPPSELRSRLGDGRIYKGETARRALEGYFKEGNLAALREIALRRTAEKVDGDVRGWMRDNRISGPWPAGERILALVGPNAGGEAVVRHAKRLSEALHAPWIALHVERPAKPSDCRAAMALASQLGAETEVRSGADLVGTALEFAGSRNVTGIVMGRSPAPLWRRLTGRILGTQLLRRAPEYALHVVPLPAAARPRTAPARAWQSWVPWAVATALVAAVTGAGLLLGPLMPQEALGMVFLAAVVAAASLQGLRVALYTAAIGFLAWDFFFIPPIHTVTIANTHDAVAAAVFLAVAGMTGILAGRVRAEAQAGQARIEGLRRVGAFSRRLGAPATEPELLQEIARQAASIVGRAVVLTGTDDTGEDVDIRAAQPPADTMDAGAWAAARWCYTRAEETGRGTSTLPGSTWRFLPMRTVRGMLGVLGMRPDEAHAANAFDPSLLQAAEALADQSAVALERVRLANQSARTAAMEETQRLRTALLNSLSHDLRTPLTGIRGAAGTLRDAWDTLAPEVRSDLLASIEQDTARMARFLANIMDLTRLESGQIVPRLEPVEVAEVVEAAIARVPEAAHVGVAQVDPDLRVQADAALLEQALVNVLDNAVKYAPAGAQPMVRVIAERAQVCIAVADEGVGIPPADLPHVFDSFYRARRGDRVAPGTGLGLAIARGLVEAMGGTIEAVSPRPDLPRDGSPGTVISLRLPIA
jgi:two-component system sensor histidine kinase KdpD